MIALTLLAYAIILAELIVAGAFFQTDWWSRTNHLTHNILIGMCFVFPLVFLFMAAVLVFESLKKQLKAK